MALVDSMLSMFGIWSFYFFLLAVESVRFDFAMLAGFALGGALLTKSPALFFSLLLPTIVFFSRDFSISTFFKKTMMLRNIRVLLLLLPVYLIGYGMFNILRLGPNFELLSSRNLDYVYPISHILTQPFNPFLAHLKDIGIWFVYLGPLFLPLLFLLGLWQGIAHYKKQTLVLLLWFLLPLLVQAEFAKVFTARYILFVIPYFLIISSLAILTQKRLKKLVLTLMVLFVLASVWQDANFIFDPAKALLPRVERAGYLEQWTAGTGIAQVANYLVDLHAKNQGKEAVVGTEGYFGTLPDGLQIYLNNYPDIKVIGVGVNLREVPEALINSKKAGVNTFLVINTSRLQITNSDSMGLKLISSYPKAQKPDGSSESLLFFKLR
jgi:hypothetical protein